MVAASSLAILVNHRLPTSTITPDYSLSCNLDEQGRTKLGAGTLSGTGFGRL